MPQTVYIPKLPRPKNNGVNKKINYSMTLWQRGYIRNRLMQKCREQAVGMVEVIGKDISNECSNCGAVGSKKKGVFSCMFCGYTGDDKTNAAQNALKRGLEGKILN